MHASCRFLIGLMILAGTTAAADLPEPDEKELAHNHKKFDDYRKDPAQYERLKRDWRALRALPTEKQARIRQLHYDLQQKDVDTQAKLRRVLERYAAWLERLPEDDQQRVHSAGGADDRLQIVQELREREWLDRLPRARRELVQKTPADKRPELIARLREEERKSRQEWQRAAKERPKLLRPVDLPPEVRTFLEESLVPLLSDREKQDLKSAQGKWFYGPTIVELADRHPIKMPPSPRIGPRNMKELREFSKPVPAKLIQDPRLREMTDNRWPEFALQASEVARNKKIPIPPLGPCRPNEFAPSVQRFIEKELLPVLDEEERKRLDSAAGKWPDYPEALMELAKNHQLQVPGMVLPGPKEWWDNLRPMPPMP